MSTDKKINNRPDADIEDADFKPSPKDQSLGESRIADRCPYCQSAKFVKRGTRKKKYETVQLYLCGNEQCGRTFTAQSVKGKRWPLKIIIEGMSYYNLGYNLEESCSILRQKFGAAPEPATLSHWVDEYKELCRYERMRPYAVKLFKPEDTVEVASMAHRQLYRFRYHRAKTALILQEYPNRELLPIKDYLENVSSETPYQYFQEGERMSEIRSKFDKADMLVKSKKNFANLLADFVLSAVKANKDRHEQLQRFFIANDSVTVATEVPVYIRKEDVEHMETALGFKITDDGNIQIKAQNPKPKGQMNVKIQSSKSKIPLPKLITGHIDLVQIRNGLVHLLDFKPKAEKERPIEQLTWYALALSRLTGLRVFHFKCGWFDEKGYYEFYPLHVVKKIRAKKKRRVRFLDGTVAEVPRKDKLAIV